MTTSPAPIATSRIASRILGAIALGVTVLAAATLLLSVLARFVPAVVEREWAATGANHLAMLLVSGLLILGLARGRIADYGIQWPRGPWVVRVVALAVSIALIAFLLKLWLPAKGIEFVRTYTFLQVVVWVWIVASVAEEVLTRGLIQSYLSPLAGRRIRLLGIAIGLPAGVGALFFSLMHLMLLTTGVDLWTVGLILLFALAVGLVAGVYREKTGSLLPAIVAHTVANATGTVLHFVLSN